MAEKILVGIVGVFILWLIVRLFMSHRQDRRIDIDEQRVPESADDELVRLVDECASQGKTRESLRKIVGRAHEVSGPSLRAAHHCAAGNLSLRELKRPGLAVHFYLRALRDDPSCGEALDHLRQILVAQKRMRRLERTYWDVLARLDDSEEHLRMWVKCWTGLAGVYSASRRTANRADAIRKALDTFGVESD